MQIEQARLATAIAAWEQESDAWKPVFAERGRFMEELRGVEDILRLLRIHEFVYLYETPIVHLLLRIRLFFAMYTRQIVCWLAHFAVTSRN